VDNGGVEVHGAVDGHVDANTHVDDNAHVNVVVGFPKARLTPSVQRETSLR
jgi:hypothetical protein